MGSCSRRRRRRARRASCSTRWRRIDAHAAQLTTPLLAMHGSADAVESPEGSRRIVQRAGSGDKQLYLYDGLAHDLLHEPERARVLRDVSAWLDERAPA